MSSQFDLANVSTQVKTLIIPCSRCRHLHKMEFLNDDRVLISCKYQTLEKKFNEMVKVAGKCPYYCESIENLEEVLKSELNEC